MPPRVSVVIPTYNNASHIVATVESVLDQTYSDFELLISDHSSADGTWDLVQRFKQDERVTVDRIAPGGGAQANWNHVSARASGEFIKLLCGDDLLTPDCLAQQVAAFDSGGDGVVMVTARRDVIDSRGRILWRCRGLAGLEGRVSGPTAARQSFRAGTNIFGEPCCVLLRTRDLDAIGHWDGRDGYVIDWATYLTILRRGDLVALPESLASFRLSGGQWSIKLARQQRRQVDKLRTRQAVEWPDLLTARDRTRSAGMTRVRTFQRRLVYKVLSHRL